MRQKTYDTLKELFTICAILGAIMIDLTAVVKVPGFVLAAAILSTIGAGGLKYLAQSSKAYFADKLIVGSDEVIAADPEEPHE